MRKSQGLISVLLFSLAVLMTAAVNETKTNAALNCSDLKKCSGEAGCPSGGNLSGCTITCTNGGYAYCNSGGGGEEEEMLVE